MLQLKIALEREIGGLIGLFGGTTKFSNSPKGSKKGVKPATKMIKQVGGKTAIADKFK